MTNRRQFIAGLAAAGATSTLSGLAFADDVESAWARIHRTGTLRIGAVAGASPYYNKDLATGQWQGFMIDFANDLASSLKVKLDVNETTWGNSVLDLQSNKIDVFFGLNPTPQRALVVDFSDPLFNNAFVLVARKDFSPKTWEEMNKPEVKIAVDIGSSHDAVVTKMCPKAQIIRLEKAADATLAVQTGRADCQVLAVVLALTVISKNPTVGHIVLPTPTQATTTNLGFRKESDRQWVEYVNKWIAQTRASGKVKQVVLSNMQTLSGVKPEQVPAEISFCERGTAVYQWDFGFLWGFRNLLWIGLLYTAAYTLICTLLGLAIGLAVAIGRLAKPLWVRAPLRAYVEVFRCTPVLVQLVWFYYALPVLTGIQISAALAAILALSFYGSAFYSEIIRGGIISIDPEQSDAARALGMRRFQVMRRIVLPQAFRRMVPPLLNQTILQLKNTSLLSVLALPDLLYQGQAIAHETYRPLETYTVVALAYFAVLLPATILVKRAETRLNSKPVAA